jgi:hypothetical protein
MKSAYGAAAASLFLLVGLSAASPAKAQAKKIKNCTTITESGAYKVTKNLVASGDCIVIEASFVNLDLGGFTLTGDGTGTGVLVPGVLDLEGIDLRNGNVTNFDTGINLSALLTSVRNVRAQDNVGDGIRAGGPAVVTGCQAHDNGGVGISAFGTSTVHRNIASSNGSHGFGMGTSVATGNTSRGRERHYHRVGRRPGEHRELERSGRHQRQLSDQHRRQLVAGQHRPERHDDGRRLRPERQRDGLTRPARLRTCSGCGRTPRRARGWAERVLHEVHVAVDAGPEGRVAHRLDGRGGGLLAAPERGHRPNEHGRSSGIRYC